MGILIHVAYGKAGSTFLQHWFRQNPELFVGNGWDLCNSTYKNLENNLTLKHFVISSEGLGSWLPHEVIRSEFDLKFDTKKWPSSQNNIYKIELEVTQGITGQLGNMPGSGNTFTKISYTYQKYY